MKKILLFLAMLAIVAMAAAQIKITSGGNVVVGGNNVYNSDTKLQINGGANNITFVPDVGGTNIGSSESCIDFWHPKGAKWNKVRFSSYALKSDSTEKTNISKILNATDILKQIKTYSFYFKSDSTEIRNGIDMRKKDYGVLAQEVQQLLPNIVDTAKGTMFVNYNAFIGILIAGFNEQQRSIETLQEIVTAQEFELIQLRNLQQTILVLQEIVYQCCEKPKNMPDLTPPEVQPLEDEAILYQNAPNPFTSNTEISYYLPETTTQAVLYIYNLQGIELQSFLLTEAGSHSVTISGSALPAGMYLYTLVVDNEIIDTKRMILTK